MVVDKLNPATQDFNSKDLVLVANSTNCVDLATWSHMPLYQRLDCLTFSVRHYVNDLSSCFFITASLYQPKQPDLVFCLFDVLTLSLIALSLRVMRYHAYVALNNDAVSSAESQSRSVIDHMIMDHCS